ncbi:unnamed protein product [Gadus morhua 'NCC']
MSKESLLASFIDLAADQNQRIASLNAANQDTISWDSSAHPRPSSYSTPDHHPSWTEVVVRGRKRGPVTASPPRLSLSNHYAALPGDTPAPPVDASTLQPQVANSAGETCHTDVGPTLRSEPRTETSASRRRIVKEAVLRRSGRHPTSALTVTHPPGPDAAGSPPHSSARSRSVDPTPSRVETREPLHSPHPLVSPTTLIIRKLQQQLELLELRQRFGIERLRFYTRFASYICFLAFWRSIEPAVTHKMIRKSAKTASASIRTTSWSCKVTLSEEARLQVLLRDQQFYQGFGIGQ